MKNKNLLVTIFCITLLATGCKTGNNSASGRDPAYLEEGNGQEDAVNTLQVGSKYRIAGPMDDLKDAVVNILGENYWPDTLLSAEELAERTGISNNMYEDFMAEYQHTEAGIDMMILVKAKEGEIETIERYLNEYRDLLLKIYEQQPLNEAKVFASRIETIDQYVCYIQLGANIADLEQQGADEMIAYCQQENERALDILEKKILNS